MSVTYAAFVAAFPEFASTTTYPQSQIDFWITQSALFLSERRFTAEQLDLVTMLWVAHNVVLGERDARAAAVGGTPGESTGPVTNKSVDKVSVGYSEGANEDGAGQWNLTTYGRRLWRLMKAVGTFMYVPGNSTRNAMYGGYGRIGR